MDYQSFVDREKTLLISPAGYGKTHSIVECVKHTTGKQLILTHTHAGITSIKEKVKKEDVASNRYHIETISSFAQKYVDSFYVGTDMPDQEKSKEYHPFIIEQATKILSSKIVQLTMSSTYTGIFVDEYQDCNKQQHEMIMTLGAILPLHIMGDPLQGIFDFNGEAVNIETDLAHFDKFPDLDVPNRWYQNNNNKALGDQIKAYRENLLNQEPIVLSNNDEIGLHVYKVEEGDLFNSASDYRTKLNHIITNRRANPDLESLLIIVPEYEEIKDDGQKVNKGDINQRAKLKGQIDYTKALILLEAIDDRSFYSLAKDADEIIDGINRSHNKIKRINNSFLKKIFGATELTEWFNATGLINKRSPLDKAKTELVSTRFEAFLINPNGTTFHALIMEAKKQFKLKPKRQEVFRTLMETLRQSHYGTISVLEAMKNSRNHIRRSGRKIHGKCMGTTLLTKGLEFDTVVLIDAHRFDSPEHLYVAISRCCRKLVIFTTSFNLSPYSLPQAAKAIV